MRGKKMLNEEVSSSFPSGKEICIWKAAPTVTRHHLLLYPQICHILQGSTQAFCACMQTSVSYRHNSFECCILPPERQEISDAKK